MRRITRLRSTASLYAAITIAGHVLPTAVNPGRHHWHTPIIARQVVSVVTAD
jgi:hypothetical protein